MGKPKSGEVAILRGERGEARDQNSQRANEEGEAFAEENEVGIAE